jgi:hypothetical protein
MEDDWVNFLDKINEEIKKLEASGADLILFRGHNNNQWKLTPSLYREPWDEISNLTTEQNLQFDFELYSGPLYDRKLTSWEQLFEMRHSRIPTRLLDWTENFGSALFFALDGVDWRKNEKSKNKISPCIWMLDPYTLNEKFYNDSAVCSVDELGFDYTDLFDKNLKNQDKILKIKGPIAITPPRLGRRSFAQKSIFTLHMVSKEPIDKICDTCVKKFNIPLNSISDAYSFLKLAGVNDYSLFPDTDGLGRYLVKRL